MNATFLQRKPVIYGSPLANLLFLSLLLLHILPAVVAPIAGIVALATKKGGRLHIRSGKAFVWSMVAAALSGIALDGVRLVFFVKENHTKYAGYSMPSTYPARFAFLFVALCILYFAWETVPPRVFRQKSTLASWIPLALVIIGLALTAIIARFFNPWTGALWMIWTFMLLVMVDRRLAQGTDRGVGRHRFGMSVLAAFSWWGALQGFGPAIAIAIQGSDPSTKPYAGDQPGSYSPQFWGFLAGWAPSFLIAAYLIDRFTKIRRAAIAA